MKNSNFQPVGFKVSYINNYPKGKTDDPEPFLLSTYAMHWCMMATFMNRLFTREDMKEFLFRLAITLDTLKVMENWFSCDRLMNFSYRNHLHELTAHDILLHYGLEVTDSVCNGKEREFYMSHIAMGIRNAMFAGAFEGYQVIGPEKKGKQTTVISGEKHLPNVTDQLIKNAEFFACDILKGAPEGFFEATNPAKTEKIKEIEARKKAIADLPKFDITLIPDRIIHQCLKTMMQPETYRYYTEKAGRDEFEEEKYRLVYFAWLWANGLMVSDGLSACEAEGIHLDHEQYEFRDDAGGINLLQTYENLNVGKILPLLKGVGIRIE
ncbi:MAG: hypothetical protein JXR52_07175 [Bacteroidales bacterium]|nr:hypothetical protein [Bacteroidales bacterium]MBN2698592.1 hypothetical protein [Bacteroidales bacterium]